MTDLPQSQPAATRRASTDDRVPEPGTFAGAPGAPSGSDAAGGLSLPERMRVQTWALFIIAFAALIWILVAGRFILMALVLSVIVFSLTHGTIVRISALRIAGRGLPGWLAATIAIMLITFGLLLCGVFLVAQMTQLVLDMMAYSEQASVAVAQAFSWLSESTRRDILETLRAINVNAYLRSVAAQLSSLFSVTVMTGMFAGFLFAEQHYFRAKLFALFPTPERAAVAGRVVRSIIERVNRYLFVKTAVSLAVGLIVYLTMISFGLEFAMAVALLSFVLNYIPNLGTFIASGIAILAALIQQPAWEMMAAFTALIVVVQFLSGNIIEPVLMGRRLALSTLGIVVSLTFWGAVWGVMGMFLAVPLNVAMMVAFSYIPALRPFAILLSRDGEIDTEALQPQDG